MRRLSKSQKKMLTQEYEFLVASGIEFPDIGDIRTYIYDTVYDMNPFETFEAHIDTLFGDLNAEWFNVR